MSTKPNVAFIELTCCAGCECALLDKNEKFFQLLHKINIVEARLLEDCVSRISKYDISFVVGTPSTKEQIEYLKEIRKKTGVMVAFGNCAIFGSVWASKNWRDKDALMKKVYKLPQGIDNLAVKGVKDIVPVEYEIPTCPINADEFIRVVYDLLAGRQPVIPLRPVCYECQLRGYECVLMKGEPCFGPATLGGCEAVCLKNKTACQACRGPLEGANFESLWQQIVTMVGKERAMQILEIFGVKDKYLQLLEVKKNEK